MSRLDPSDERVAREVLASCVYADTRGVDVSRLTSIALENVKASRLQAADAIAELERAGCLRRETRQVEFLVVTPEGVKKHKER